MHVVVSWDIKVSKPQWDVLDAKLKQALLPHLSVRVLTTFYVVQISTEADRQSLIERLAAVAKPNPSSVQIIVSPAMVGGQYNGWLPQALWDQLNLRSQL